MHPNVHSSTIYNTEMWKQPRAPATDDKEGNEFKQTLGDGEGQGSLVCCGPQGCKESDMAE